MDGLGNAVTIAVVLLAGVLMFAILYGLTLLSRVVRGLDDIQDQLEDMRTRLGVLDPGETRVAQASPENSNTPTAGSQARAPDETFPGTGSG